jgi:hypothetical protein
MLSILCSTFWLSWHQNFLALTLDSHSKPWRLYFWNLACFYELHFLRNTRYHCNPESNTPIRIIYIDQSTPRFSQILQFILGQEHWPGSYGPVPRMASLASFLALTFVLADSPFTLAIFPSTLQQGLGNFVARLRNFLILLFSEWTRIWNAIASHVARRWRTGLWLYVESNFNHYWINLTQLLSDIRRLVSCRSLLIPIDIMIPGNLRKVLIFSAVNLDNHTFTPEK